MTPQSTPTLSDAFQNLVQRQNQTILDGSVVGVLGNGQVSVSAQELTLLCPTVLDHYFQVGEPVILARDDADEWVIIGVGQTGAAETGGPPGPMVTPIGQTSQSLQEAFCRVIARQNQVLRRGIVVGILDSGALVVNSSLGNRLMAAATTQEFQVGQAIYALSQDDGEWLALGSR